MPSAEQPSLPARLRAVARSGFLRNIATVSGGQVLGTLFPLLAAPVLGRLYSPADYGLLGTYLGYSTVLVAIGNWTYSQGIIVEKLEIRARALVRVCLLTASATAAGSVPLAIWLAARAETGARFWFVLLPLTTFLGGFAACLSALAIRRSDYRSIALAQALSSLLTVGFSLALGWAQVGAIGLFAAWVTGQLFSFSLLLWSHRRASSRDRAPVPWSHVRAMLRRHRDFAVFTTPTAFIGNFTMSSPIYALTEMSATSSIGFFSRASQLLSVPINLLGGAVAQVFQRRAAIDYIESGSCWAIYRKSLSLLLGAGLLPTALLALFSPVLFAWFLGPAWREAGEIARLLAPMLLLRLVCSPLSTVFYVVGAQREDFILSVITSLLTLSAVGAALLSGASASTVIACYAAGYCLTYIIFIIRSAHHARRS